MSLDRDYRNTLRRALVERCQRNPKYSLRSFARDLGITPARLSDILNGKKGLSRQVATALASVLGLSSKEAEIFCDQVESLHARSKTTRALAAKRVQIHLDSHPERQSLTLDTFRAVSDWYHFAILQLMRLPQFNEDDKWISRVLEIQPVQVKEALERLERLEMIEKKDGRWTPTEDYVLSPDGIPSDAIKKFHDQILKKTLDALYVQPVSERDFLTSLLPIAIEDLPKIKECIRQFNQKICTEFSFNPKANRVYSFSTQFVSLTPHLKESES